MNRWIYNDVLYTMGKKVYEFKEIEEAKESPAIVHFAGGVAKPWKNLRTAYADKWWEYARQILNEEEYATWYKKAEAATERRDWKYLKKRLEKYETVVIFGAGKNGGELLPVLRKWGHDVKGFIDNDVVKQGKEYNGYKVWGIDSELLQLDSVAVVSSVQNHWEEIRMQLIDKGVSSERIVDYNAKNEIYYMSLNPQYYEYEFRDMCVGKFGWKIDR